MDNVITALKLGIATHLEKQGSSLEEFETSLRDLNSEQGATKLAELLTAIANVEKVAFWGDIGSGIAGFAGDTLKAIPEAGVTSAMILGTMGGAGAYGLKSYIDGEDKEISKKQQEVDRIKNLTERLKQDYGLHSHNG